MTVDEQKVQEFAFGVVEAMLGAATVVSIHLGDRLGLYRALAPEPATADELADRTGCNPRLVAEWLDGQTAHGFVVRGADGRAALPAEHAAVLAVEDSPAYLAAGAGLYSAIFRNQERIETAFRTDGALPWGEQHESLFAAVDGFYAAGYRASLVSAWLPALEGVTEKLTTGARVLDVGCGFGTATTLLAAAYPATTVVGVDAHQPSLDEAAKRAAAAGVADRVQFVPATATSYDGGPYDLICFFDSLHDLGDPAGALAHARRQLADDGTVMAVEPMAADSLEEAVGNPVSRLFYSGSATLCTPHALSEGGAALGNQVPDRTYRELCTAVGFTQCRRATETPFNRVFEARP